jgi:catechol 2,3-dioxygenase-like lactoylglutathione lyase family enzyme
MNEKSSYSPGLRPINNTQHTAYRCRDAEQTRWYYEDVLGLKLAAALDFEEHSGVEGEARKYMHLFFAMGDGNLVAFFDDPDNVATDFFDKKMNGFDSHIAMEVDDMESLLAMQKRIQDAGITCLGPLDHGFAFSVYAYDPSGVQTELICKADNYGEIMAGAAQSAHQSIRDWSEKTRAKKEALFGSDALDTRGKAKAA